MESADLRQSINRAIDAGDWSQVRTLGEQLLSEGEASSQVLYNLGLAYLHENNPALAMSVLLAIPRSTRDDSAKKAIQEALLRANLDQSALHLGSHGFKAILIDMADLIAPVPFHFIAAISIPILLFVIILLARLSEVRQSFFNSLLGRMFGIGVVALSLIVFLSLSLGWFSDAMRGRWCAVVSSDAKIMSQPNFDSEVNREIQIASPVLAISDPQQSWVRVLHSSGSAGWMESLKMRCIDEPK